MLNSEEAVRAFSMGGNLTVGGNISAAAGPIGTGGAVQASLASPAPMFSYSKSKGLYPDDCPSFITITLGVIWAFLTGLSQLPPVVNETFPPRSCDYAS